MRDSTLAQAFLLWIEMWKIGDLKSWGIFLIFATPVGKNHLVKEMFVCVKMERILDSRKCEYNLYLTATVSSMISLVSSATSRKVWGSWGDRLPAPYITRKYRKAIQYSIQCWKKFSKAHPYVSYIEVNSISAEILLLIQKSSSFYKSKCKDTHFLQTRKSCLFLK